MGYAATAIVMYGIEVDDGQAEDLDRELRDLILATDGLSDDEIEELTEGTVTAIEYMDRLGWPGDLAMRADGADSRIHDTEWVNDESMGGIHLASILPRMDMAPATTWSRRSGKGRQRTWWLCGARKSPRF